MKRLFLQSLILLVVLGPWSACQEVPLESSSTVMPNRASLAGKVWQSKEVSSKIVLIYDFAPDQSKLEYRAVELKDPSGDALKDALTAFFRHSQLKGDYRQLMLDDIKQDDETPQLNIVGQASFPSLEDRQLFKSALEMTIARQFSHLNFEINLPNQSFGEESRVSLAR